MRHTRTFHSHFYRILEFQTGYNAEYINGVIAYPIIDKSAQTVSRCSVTQDPSKLVNIKLATGEPPIPFTDDQLDEIAYYCSYMGFAGTQVKLKSTPADQLYVAGIIYYNGQLDPALVQANVVAAMNAYCKNFSSDSNYKGQIILDLINDALKATPGVQYTKLTEVGLRPYSLDFDKRIVLYDLSGGISLPIVDTVSGYLIGETTAGYTFSDSFTYVAV